MWRVRGFPLDAHSKGDNYDGVYRLGRRPRPHDVTQLPAVQLANGQVWLDSLWQPTSERENSGFKPRCLAEASTCGKDFRRLPRGKIRSGAPKGGMMLNADLSPAAPQGGMEPLTDNTRVVFTRRRVPTNWVSSRTLQPSIESVVASLFVPSDFLMDGQVSGLGNVHPLLTLDFFITWILPLHVVFFLFLILCTKPFDDGAMDDGTGSGSSRRPLVHALHVGGLGQMVAE